MKKKPLTHEQITAWRYKGLVADRVDWFEESVICDIDSPIEMIMANHLELLAFYSGNVRFLLKRETTPDFKDLEKLTLSQYDGCPIIWVFPQCPIGPYKADFLVVMGDINPILPPVRARISYVAVECDGHDFHEKTKTQARKDKKRDRYFQAKGVRLLRFTGSEIYGNAIDCINEIYRLLTQSDHQPEGHDALDDEDIEGLTNG